MNSISYYFLSFFWGICILLSFIGWGSLLKNILFHSKQIDWAQRAAWGVAWSIFIGGLLNLCCLISPLLIWTYIAIGILCLLYFDLQDIKIFISNIPGKLTLIWQQDRAACIGILLILSCITFYYSTWVVTRLEYKDDLEAYAVFPQKMLEQGSLGYEPFSERRTSALGGQSFLHTLVLSVLQNTNLRIIDPGIAYVIAFGLLWGISKIANVPRKAALLIMFFFLLVPPLSGNITSLIMGLVLFLAVFRHLGSEESFIGSERIGYCAITALLAAAICASKANLIVFCGIFFILFYLFQLTFQALKKNTAFECLAVFVLTFIFLLPWMISSLQSSGTMLYPLLGRGYHRSAYGFTEFPALTWASFVHIYQKTYFNFSTIFLIILYLVNLKDRPKNRILLSSTIFFSVLLGLLTLHLLEQSMDPRYSFSFFYASLMMLMLFALSEISSAGNLAVKKISYAVVFLTILFFLQDYFFKAPSIIWKDSNSLNNLYGLEMAGEPISSEDQRLSYYNAQSLIPEGHAMIARCGEPYLLNFKRNKIYIADFIILGPKPGMPVLYGGEAVAKYLLSQNIRYVLFGRDDGIEGDRKALKHTQKISSMWGKQQFLFMYKFQKDLKELKRSRRIIYTDKFISVIDLDNKA